MAISNKFRIEVVVDDVVTYSAFDGAYEIWQQAWYYGETITELANTSCSRCANDDEEDVVYRFNVNGKSADGNWIVITFYGNKSMYGQWEAKFTSSFK